jgi:hypothetical protein
MTSVRPSAHGQISCGERNHKQPFGGTLEERIPAAGAAITLNIEETAVRSAE